MRGEGPFSKRFVGFFFKLGNPRLGALRPRPPPEPLKSPYSAISPWLVLGSSELEIAPQRARWQPCTLRRATLQRLPIAHDGFGKVRGVVQNGAGIRNALLGNSMITIYGFLFPL